MWILFESRHQREKDKTELRQIFKKYGSETVDILKQRVYQSKGSKRDHRHWRRLYRKAKRGAHGFLSEKIQSAE